MKGIQRVAILGAGAIGSYFASSFYNTPGFSTVLIAKGNRLERLQNNGLVINGKAYQIPVIDPGKSKSPMDLIIVALKHHHLEQALQISLSTVENRLPSLIRHIRKSFS